MTHDEIEWTEEEREALDRLPRELDPGRSLEERTVAELKRRGLLRGRNAPSASGADDDATAGPRRRAGSGHRRPRGARPVHPAWWAAGLAAGLALFFAGVAMGQARAGITANDLMSALRTAEPTERPTLVQQTGSLYVDALASLAADTPDPETVGTGVEVGLAALYAAAYELAQLHPDDLRLQEVIRVLESQATDDAETDVHWF